MKFIESIIGKFKFWGPKCTKSKLNNLVCNYMTTYKQIVNVRMG